MAKSAQELIVSAAMFRQDDASLFLVRLLPANAPDGGANALSRLREPLLKALDGAPDGFVLTAPDGRMLATNVAFRGMTELAAEEQARGASFESWLGRPGVDFNVMTATLRQRGTVSLFATTLRGEYGAITEVVHADQTYYGFVIRDVGRRVHADLRAGRDVPRSVDQLTELIGRVPLKDLVREATDLIERLCIEAALELTGDNRASAAELLGLSRQSLYVKLRRHGLGDLGGGEYDQA
jgi:transcriptional regulator PpsR